jgi:hypothetical protein
MTDSVKELYKSAIEKFGARAQVAKAIEECSELIKVLSLLIVDITDGMDANGIVSVYSFGCERQELYEKNMINLIDELADVRIMVEQMEQIYGVSDSVRQRISEKINRLKKLVAPPPEPQLFQHCRFAGTEWVVTFVDAGHVDLTCRDGRQKKTHIAISEIELIDYVEV